MLLKRLKARVLDANLAIVHNGLVTATFGNASSIDRDAGLIAIKPSGVPYDEMTPEHIVLCDLDGRPKNNHFRPSSDLDTHLVLYRAFDEIGAVIHTHSTYATIMAQACCPIIPLGTTHADYFHGEIPVTRQLNDDEIQNRYVAATGDVIVEAFEDRSPLEIPAVLVAGHGPFVWGATAEEAVLNAVILEEIAKMAWHVQALAPKSEPIHQTLLDFHYNRKHGPKATYGQK